MRAFACGVCGQLLAFENTACLRCGAELGYVHDQRELLAVTSGPNGLVDLTGAGWHRCRSAQEAACNWLVSRPGLRCSSCALTRTRPAPGDEAAMFAFRLAEFAKRRLVFQLAELALPVVGRDPDHPQGLAFDLLSSDDKPVTTGHADGLITLDLAEGDDAHREALRRQMGEPYRTLLGHFRHETGHYYWDKLIDGTPLLAAFREAFGDERADYTAALQRHYSQGPPSDWEADYVSTYSTAHPWEDWAETFAHYLHIRDTLQTASAYGMLVVGPDLHGLTTAGVPVAAFPTDDVSDFGALMDTWLPLTYSLNAVNRSMGKGDLYPFVLTAGVSHKLRFVHDVITTGDGVAAEAAASDGAAADAAATDGAAADGATGPAA